MKIDFINPAGTKEGANNFTRFEIMYFESRKCYYLTISPITKGDGMWATMIDFKNRNTPLMYVSRRSKKALATCENWLQTNAEKLNEVYLSNGGDNVDGVRNAVRDLWHN